MWGIDSKPNAFRDRLVMAAPEANPHEFVRRFLFRGAANAPSARTLLPPDRRVADRRVTPFSAAR